MLISLPPDKFVDAAAPSTAVPVAGDKPEVFEELRVTVYPEYVEGSGEFVLWQPATNAMDPSAAAKPTTRLFISMNLIFISC
jgi:hypothetical protein